MADALPRVAPIDDIVLTASELASNVIRHARTDYTVRLLIRDRIVRLEVSDGSSIIPAIEDLVHSQRGLRIVDALSQSWGVEASEAGKTIWASFSWKSEGATVE